MKRFKLVVPSFIAIIFCMLLIAGSTFALFTSQAEASISVTSGKVEISAKFVETLENETKLKVYSAKAVDEIGENDVEAGTITEGNFAGKYIYDLQTRTHTESSKTYHLFANNADGEAAGALLQEDKLTLTRMTPGDKVEALLQIENSSNVNIKYRVRVFLVSGLKLFEELQIKLDGVLLQGVNKTGTWTYLEANADITDINVEVVLPLLSNNDFQDLGTTIKFVVEAVQGNAATTNETLNTNINVEQEIQKENNVIVDQVVSDDEQLVTVTVPAAPVAAKETNDTTVQSLAVKVEPQTTANLTLTSYQTAQSYDVDVIVTTKTGDETPVETSYNEETPLKVQMFVGTGLKGVELYHSYLDSTTNTNKTDKFDSVANEDALIANKQFFYNEETGYITLMTNHFSAYTVAYNKDLVVETIDAVTKESTFTTYEATETQGVYTQEVFDVETGKTTTETVKPQTNEQGELVFIEQVARIGDKYYTSLKEAVSAAKSGDTVELLCDIIECDQESETYISTLPYQVTLEGNNHSITFEEQSEKMVFFDYMYGTLRNLTINNINESLVYLCGWGSTFYNLTINGTISALTGEGLKNQGALIIYTFYNTYASSRDIKIEKCTINVDMNGSGSQVDYFAGFIGYIYYNSNITIKDCEFNGTLKGGRASMFIGNPAYTGTNSNIIISGFNNNGTIIRTYIGSGDPANTDQFIIGVTADNGDFGSFIIDSINYSMADIKSGLVDNVIGGTKVLGPETTLKLVKNSDGTFNITGCEGAAYYTVGVGLYATLRQGGSGSYFATQTIQATDSTTYTTTLKDCKFVDAEWVENHTDAELSHPSWNNEVNMYTLDDVNYYLIYDHLTSNGNEKITEQYYLSAFDSNGNLITSVGLTE